MNIMLIQKENEERINYLSRVLYKFMDNTVAGEEVIEYDGTECDGFCLAQDIVNELDIDIEQFED